MQMAFRRAPRALVALLGLAALTALPAAETGAQSAEPTPLPGSPLALAESPPTLPNPGRGQATLQLLGSLHRVPLSTARVLRDERGIVLNAAIATGVLLSIDRSLTQAWSEEIVPRTKAVPDLYGPHRILGGVNGWLVTGLGASWVTGVAFHQPKLERAAVQTTGSMAVAWTLAHVILKPAFGRTRPVSDWSPGAAPVANRTRDPWQFEPFRPVRLGPWDGESAMPSAHAAIYASVAEALHDVGVPRWISWTGAGAAYLSLAPKHNHWVSDMFVGGAVGVLSAAAVDRALAPRSGAGARHAQRVDLSPVVGPRQVGVAGRWAFGGP